MAAPVGISLDPNVLLVPVQVYVLYSDQHPVSTTRLPVQLALWDRVPAIVDRTNLTDGNGVRFATITHLDDWVRGGENPPEVARVDTFFVPDDIWDACNIQFRLVNYTEISTDDSNVFPTDQNLDLEAPLIKTFNSIVSADPNFIQGIPTMIFTALCTPSGVAEQGQLLPPAGISLPDAAVGCVSVSLAEFSNPQTPAHELGHVVMDSSLHASCPTDMGLNNNLMCPANGGTQLTQQQCTAARGNALGWSNFFPKGH